MRDRGELAALGLWVHEKRPWRLKRCGAGDHGAGMNARGAIHAWWCLVGWMGAAFAGVAWSYSSVDKGRDRKRRWWWCYSP